jgi:O-antigen/teichoic acid export membrane protein
MIIFAYVDPGLGLLAWQAVVAAFLGTLFYVKKTRTWLVRLFRRLFRASPPEGLATKPSAPPDDAGQ